ncbi:unnamed protein product, partial [Nesidiocoris tenuis]
LFKILFPNPISKTLKPKTSDCHLHQEKGFTKFPNHTGEPFVDGDLEKTFTAQHKERFEFFRVGNFSPTIIRKKPTRRWDSTFSTIVAAEILQCGARKLEIDRRRDDSESQPRPNGGALSVWAPSFSRNPTLRQNDVSTGHSLHCAIGTPT